MLVEKNPPAAEPDASTSDEQLATQATMHDDRQAFATLMNRHGANLIAYCKGRMWDDGSAEDAAQEAWLSAWAKRSAFADRGPGSYRSWLYTIAFRKAMSSNRGSTRRPDPIADPTPVTPVTAELLAIHRERADIFRGCVEALPERQRCIIKATIDQLKAGPAAERCGCTPEQASSAKHAAKRSLIECVNRKGV